MAGLRYLRTLPPPAGAAALQHAGGSAGGPAERPAQLVAGVRAAVRRRRPQHLLHSHRVDPAVPGEREAAGGAAAALGADGAEPEAGLRGSAVPEAGRAGPGPRPLVRPHRVAALHPVAAADDPGLPGQLRAERRRERLTAVGGPTEGRRKEKEDVSEKNKKSDILRLI